MMRAADQWEEMVSEEEREKQRVELWGYKPSSLESGELGNK